MNKEIPLHKQRMLEDLERIKRNHPMLLAHCSVITFGTEKLILTISKYETSMEEMREIALSFPETKWKPKSGLGPDIDWHGEVDGVKVFIMGAETMPLKKLPDYVDLTK